MAGHDTPRTEPDDRVARILHRVSLAILFGVACLAWGFAVGRYEVFPFPLLRQVMDFVRGDPFEQTTLAEKLENDFGNAPTRFLHPLNGATGRNEVFVPATVPDGLFRTTRELPTVYSARTEGAYLIYGVFEFTDGRYGALLIDHSGRITRHWVFEPPPGNRELNPVKGGFLPNGYVVSNAFYALQTQDFCGRPVWSQTAGEFHHSVEPAGDDSIWVFNAFDFERRSAADGSLEESFSIFDVIEANPDLHVFEPRLEMTGWEFPDLARATQSFPNFQFGLSDPFHFNDVTPLSADLAAAYPDFEAGDLLVSSRALNLLFVVRPSTRKVVWHALGLTSRQHDPDFDRSGTIVVFDNENHEQFSRLVEIDPATNAMSVLVDGATIDLKNDAHGNQTVLPDGSIVLVDYRGRVIHVDRDGRVVFEFRNLWTDDRTIEVRNVHYLTDSEVAAFERGCGAAPAVGD